MKSQRMHLSTSWIAVLGGFGACCATVLAELTRMFIKGDNTEDIATNIAFLADEAARSDRLNVLLIAPVVETFLFLIAFKLIQAFRIARRKLEAILGLALFMGLVGWLIHDARDAVVAQSFGFAVLGALFAALWFQSGSIIAFAGTALAHMIWNASILTLALTYSPHAVWEGRVKHGAISTPTEIVGDFESVEQCRQMSRLFLQQVEASHNDKDSDGANVRIACERVIRSRW